MKISVLLNIGICTIMAKLLKKRYPLAIAFELTRRCNLSCPHCYAQGIIGELDKKEHFFILSELHSAGCKILSFTGGEPLLVGHLPELIVQAKKYRMWVQYTTNGLLLPELEEGLKHTGFDMIQISLDGDCKTHEMARGEGSFFRAMKAFDVIKRNRWRCLIVSVMNKYTTVEDIVFVLGKAIECGAIVSFQPMCDSPDMSIGKELLFSSLDFLRDVRKTRSIDTFINVLNKYDIKNTLPAIVKNRAFYNPMEQSEEFLRNLYKFPKAGTVPCTAGILFGRVLPDGELVPCYYAIDRTETRNILTDGFQKCWERLNKPECMDCWHHHRLELNLIYNLSIPTIYSVLYAHIFRKKYRVRDR